MVADALWLTEEVAETDAEEDADGLTRADSVGASVAEEPDDMEPIELTDTSADAL